MSDPTGLILYEGPSLIDGQPIVAVACSLWGGRANRKTGKAVQTYILRSDQTPTDAAAFGADRSVCGDCKLRPANSGVCYVELGKGTWWTYEAYKRGAYPWIRRSDYDDLRGKYIRLGTYGDPAAVPIEVWRPLVEAAGNWSGYTHQWRSCDQRFRHLLMASVESPEEAEEAQALGWRTFRLRLQSEPLGEMEIVCPGSDEGGSRRQCRTCRACRGNRKSPDMAGRSVAIEVHGRPWKSAQFRRLIEGAVIMEGTNGNGHAAPAKRSRGRPRRVPLPIATEHTAEPVFAGPARPLGRMATYPLDSGQVELSWSRISADELDQLQDWLCLIVERMKREAKGVAVG